MDIRSILGVTSVLVGAGVVVGQDPSFEFPGAKPVLTSDTGGSITVSDEQQKVVSVRFKNASVDEVFDWLSNQGISFVTAGISKDTKVDLNLVNVPLNEAIDVIGDSLGGSFLKRGSSYVFQKGVKNFSFGSVGSSVPILKDLDHTIFQAMPSMPSFQNKFKDSFVLQDKDGVKVRLFGSDKVQSEKEWREFHQEMMKEFGADSNFAKEMKKQGAESKSFEKNFNHKMFEKNFSKQLSEKDAQKWEAYGKEIEKKFGPGSAFQKNIDKQYGPGSEFEKKMKVFAEQDSKKWEEYGKKMEKQFGPGSEFEKKMKAYELTDGKFKQLDSKEHEKLMKELQEHMKKMQMDLKFQDLPKMDGKAFVMPPMPPMPPMPKSELKGFKAPNPPSISFGGGDITQVIKTLSASQREKNKSRGFLYWSDLTKEQQSKLGMKDSSGTWNITYSKDGETFTVKSDPK